MESIDKNFFKVGTVPYDGTDPNILSTKFKYGPYSFLTNGPSLPPDQDKSPYLPNLPPPTYMLQKDLYVDVNYSIQDLRKFWDIETSGKLVYIDEEMLKQSKGAFGEMLKKFAKSIFIKNIQGLSFPVRLNECRGFTDKVIDFLRLVPIFLHTASKIDDKLERQKLYVAASISSLIMTLARAKVFESFIGETTQASLSDGTQAYVECTNALPQTAHYYSVSKTFTVDGRCQLLPKVGLGVIEINSNNYQRVVFQDGHTLEYLCFPSFRVSGLVFGKRRMVASKFLVIEDKVNSIRSIVYFVSDSKTEKRDTINGIIYKYKPDPLRKYLKCTKVSELTDVEEVYAKVTGYWTSIVEIGGLPFWKANESKPLDLIYSGVPIPSDFRFREDIIWLKRRNLKLADCWKDSLELRNKRDNKLRKSHKH